MLKNLKENYKSMNVPNKCVSEESDFESETLRSLPSSSEDENAKIGYIGPPYPRKRKVSNRKGSTSFQQWEVGQQFVNMAEFREAVRKYGVTDRRGYSL